MLNHPLVPDDGADDVARDVTHDVTHDVASGETSGGASGGMSGMYGYTLWPREMISQRGRLPSPAYREERRAYIAPFFAYCERRAIISLRIARRAALRRGEGMTRQKLYGIKVGRIRAPLWFIAEVCHELGQPVEIVMGAEWAQRHLPMPTPDLPSGTRPGERLGEGLDGGRDGGRDGGLDAQRRAS